jgi:hypothetical protein
MHEREKSDPAIRAGKPTNKAEATSVANAAEPVKPYALIGPVRICAGCALQVRSTQPSEMAAAAKPSEQPRTESCVVFR